MPFIPDAAETLDTTSGFTPDISSTGGSQPTWEQILGGSGNTIEENPVYKLANFLTFGTPEGAKKAVASPTFFGTGDTANPINLAIQFLKETSPATIPAMETAASLEGPGAIFKMLGKSFPALNYFKPEYFTKKGMLNTATKYAQALQDAGFNVKVDDIYKVVSDLTRNFPSSVEDLAKTTARSTKSGAGVAPTELLTQGVYKQGEEVGAKDLLDIIRNYGREWGPKVYKGVSQMSSEGTQAAGALRSGMAKSLYELSPKIAEAQGAYKFWNTPVKVLGRNVGAVGSPAAALLKTAIGGSILGGVGGPLIGRIFSAGGK